jgi:DNA polymerase-3 subunit chi
VRVDFYQLSRDPAEAVVPVLAANTLKAGEKMLVISGDASQRAAISQALWSHAAESFLAHGEAGGPHDARQPVLLSHSVEASNAAKFVLLADGAWREGLDSFARVFLLFGPAAIDGARACWRMLGERDGVERNFWVQDGGRWRPGP